MLLLHTIIHTVRLFLFTVFVANAPGGVKRASPTHTLKSSTKTFLCVEFICNLVFVFYTTTKIDLFFVLFLEFIFSDYSTKECNKEF